MRTRSRLTLVVAALTLASLAFPARASEDATEPPSPPALAPPAPVPAEASGTSGRIDVEAATRAYLAELTGPARERSDAYFEGGYWLLLWDFLWGAGVSLLLLFTGWSAVMRDRAESWTRRPFLRGAAFAAQYLVASTALSLPLTVYEGFVREHQYGLSNLTLGGWLAEQGKGLAVALVLGAPAIALLYRVVARAGRAWWLWGAATAAVLLLLVQVITPVFLVPIFNTPRRLDDPRVAGPILSMARANGLDAGEVWEVDASRQTNRISANVAGLLGTKRITLNDNLLARCSLPEIEAVMGHELGHYVMDHAYTLTLELGLVIAAGLAAVGALFERLRRRFEARWRVRGIEDPAGLPLVALLFSAFMLLATPLTNSIVRNVEQEADVFGLDAARQPDGFARAALKLADYRKLEPGTVEEWIFYDHPSGRTRIRTAMRWKAEHPETWPEGKEREARP
jgi:STE24 endopeptidase